MGQQATQKTKVKLHLSLFDWRVSGGIGFLAGIVTVAAPQYVGMLLLLGVILATLKLIEKGRL